MEVEEVVVDTEEEEVVGVDIIQVEVIRPKTEVKPIHRMI